MAGVHDWRETRVGAARTSPHRRAHESHCIARTPSDEMFPVTVVRNSGRHEMSQAPPAGAVPVEFRTTASPHSSMPVLTISSTKGLPRSNSEDNKSFGSKYAS